MDRITKVFRHKNLLVKLKASSLIETIVATILIMIVFGIALTSITNILENTVKNSTNEIDSKLNKLVYQYEYGLVKVPDMIEAESWNIETKKVSEGELKFIVFKAVNNQSQKVRMKKLLEK